MHDITTFFQHLSLSFRHDRSRLIPFALREFPHPLKPPTFSPNPWLHLPPGYLPPWGMHPDLGIFCRQVACVIAVHLLVVRGCGQRNDAQTGRVTAKASKSSTPTCFHHASSCSRSTPAFARLAARPGLPDTHGQLAARLSQDLPNCQFLPRNQAMPGVAWHHATTDIRQSDWKRPPVSALRYRP